MISYAEIVPLDTFERSFALFFMLVGGTLYAYMIGAICGLVSMADPATQEFQNNSDLLNEYIRENSIRGEHKLRLREFFSHCKEGIRMRYYKVRQTTPRRSDVNSRNPLVPPPPPHPLRVPRARPGRVSGALLASLWRKEASRDGQSAW